MTQTSTLQCGACGAPAEFSPLDQAIACPFCRAKRPIATQPAVQQQPVETIPDAMAVRQTAMRTATCSNCGASAEVAPTTAAMQCAFCTHPLSLAATTETRLPASNVVPFRVDKNGAAAAFQKWLAGLWFRPNDLKTAARLDHIRGVYIPSWIFSASAWSQWQAEAGYHYYVDEVQIVNGQKQVNKVQKTRWEHARGQHQQHYTDLFVSASKGLSKEELVALEPFDLHSSMVAFEDDFLAGFEAECLATTARNAWVSGDERVRGKERDACRSLVPGDTQRNLQVQTQLGNIAGVSALVPVYIAAYIYNSAVFRLVVNGQSAKVIGKAPWSWVKITFAVLTVLAIIAVIVIAMQSE